MTDKPRTCEDCIWRAEDDTGDICTASAPMVLARGSDIYPTTSRDADAKECETFESVEDHE